MKARTQSTFPSKCSIQPVECVPRTVGWQYPQIDNQATAERPKGWWEAIQIEVCRRLRHSWHDDLLTLRYRCNNAHPWISWTSRGSVHLTESRSLVTWWGRWYNMKYRCLQSKAFSSSDNQCNGSVHVNVSPAHGTAAKFLPCFKISFKEASSSAPGAA